MKLTRISNKPILKPNKSHNWEKSAVFNCGMVYDNGLFHMIYRATDIGGDEKYGKYINNLGYAVSKDLKEWHRLEKPIFENDVPQELRGQEDPRIVKIDDTFHMTYTGLGDRFQDDYRICHAKSKDLINWERQGVLLDEPNKDASFFPQKINGEYLLLHRRHPDIWISSTKDMKIFYNHSIIMKTIHEHEWESERIGIAGPPVKHPKGWLLFYHAVDSINAYRLGVALLDYKNPHKVLARQSYPVIEPELDWEINGFVPNVIFSCATVDHDDKYYVVYSGADTLIGVAFIKKEDVIFDKKDWLI